MIRYGDVFPDFIAESHRQKAAEFEAEETRKCGGFCLREEVEPEPIRIRREHPVSAPLPEDAPLEARVLRWNRALFP